MAELLLRYSKKSQKNQATRMAWEIIRKILGITRLKELPREIRRFESPADHPDFHALITFVELEVTKSQMNTIRKECLVLMQTYATIGQPVRIVVVRQEGEFDEGMGNVTSLS